MTGYIVVGVAVLADIVTGILNALYHGEMDSTKLRKGLFHKLAEIIATVLSGLAEYGAKYVDIGVDIPVLGVVVTYIVVMEFVSVCENLAEMNPQLAKLFAPYLGKLKGDVTNERDEHEA